MSRQAAPPDQAMEPDEKEKTVMSKYTEVNGVWLPLRRRVSFGERGSVKTRVIELAAHEVSE
ncbi:hypothetical protein NITMOv2_3454 [Nitrospira moscoviensis]|uniref:Uncharacterized protein n=1 Tax=Nitrospira moscoviensis TaxID=42253 RepID=A0A0K2GFX2_NITMO|nr:hypothetical protein NITMOv2_3454 [Nitrospira moscoviensis]